MTQQQTSMDTTFSDLTVQYLKSLKFRGISNIVIDDEARQILREWTLQMRSTRSNGSTRSKDISQGHEKNLSSSTPAAQGPTVDRVDDQDQGIIDFTHLRHVLSADSEPSTENPVISLPTLGGNTLEEKLNALRTIAEHWQPARVLGTLRPTMVFATGDPHASLMLIGEAPGYHEERLREPFVGPAGEKLDGILKAMGLSRQQVYISNIVKFRPSIPRQTTNNRPPTPQEITYCLPIITKEIELINPRAIIALGATAAKGLLGTANTPLSALRGKFHNFQGIPVRVTYHPSYLLRNEELSERRKVWEDMLAIMELLGMPISDKQRHFFLPRNR